MKPWGIGGLAAGLLLVVATPGASQESDFRWSEAMPAGSVLEVRAIRGDVHATVAEGSTAIVTARKRGSAGDFDRVQVHVERDRDGVVLCVTHEGRMDPDDPCDWDGDDRGGDGPRVSVDFEILVPAGIELVAGTVVGDVDVEDLRSDVSASSVSGDVSVTTSEVAHASSVSGELYVRMGGTHWDDLHFSTVSGDIELHLPPDIGADLRFRSVSGDLRTDFDAELDYDRGRFVGSRVRGTIGGGGRRLSFNTVSGDVRIYRLGR